MLYKQNRQHYEGILIRYIHILEPHWTFVRINQVFGRAVRLKSHELLDPEDRSVALGGTVAVGSFQVRTVNMSNQNYDTKRVSVLLFHD